MVIDVPLVLARWVHFLCLMIVFGASLFPLYALRGGVKAESARALAITERRVCLAASLALISALVWVASSFATMVGGFDGLDLEALEAFFLETSFGPVWLVRLVIISVLVLVLAAIRSSRGRTIFSVWLAAAALASQAWLGHAAMRTGRELAIELLSYVTHVLAGGAWVGGLLALASLLASRGSDPGDAGTSECHAALRRFSNLGMIWVLLILLSGVANSVFRLKSFGDLFTTPYGQLILAKTTLFSLMLLAAAINRWRLMPRLENKEDEATLFALRRNVTIEQGLAVLVLGVAAILGTLPPRA
ncbi:MAG: copper homeostasis membrane protein CopD [Hyphomicrobiales bacterium]|nr:copper homeostasis membrane protein CopD [Hyphomicrobiales bacterium]